MLLFGSGLHIVVIIMAKKYPGKLAYCGDSCTDCLRHVATMSGNLEQLREVGLLWQRVGWRKHIVAPEEIICHGCQDIEKCEYQVKECCIEKGLQNCGRCTEYPCAKIEKAFEITEQNAERFRSILSKEEYEMFYRAFFLKKKNLDRVSGRTQ